MAFDLSKIEPRRDSVPDPTFRRETTMPRQDTDRPELEVNRRITRPDTSGVEQLQKILGLANDVGQEIFKQDQERRDNRDAADAMLDFGSGQKNDQRFAKSRAYRDAWQFQGAKTLAINIGNEATAAVTARLNDSDHPATLEDIDGAIEGIFQKHVMGPDGKPLDFGTPEAKRVLINSLNEIRSNLLPQAQAAIKKQTDERLLGTVVENKVYEFYRGAPVGAARDTLGPIQDPLAPLPDAQVVPTRTVYAPSTSSRYYSPGGVVEPFSGFKGAKPSSGLGAAREGGSRHNGEDFPVPSGTPIAAPMFGKVVKAFTNARGGNQVIMEMANGARVGFAHLSRIDVKEGETVNAGQPLGLSGNTGHTTGPHVHMTVTVDGKKVSPSQYFAQAKFGHGGSLPAGPAPVTTGDEPVLASAPPPEAPAALAPFDFEGAMHEVPTSIDRKTAKNYILQSLINTANQKGDIGLLKGLEDSHRGDGTPSFTPDEIATILQARDTISNKVRIEAEQQRQAMWEKNHNAVIDAVLSDKPPSIGWLRQQAHAGLLDPDFAFTLENHFESEARSQRAEARAETREALAEANAELDADAAGMIALRQAGQVDGASAQSDLALLNSGRLGQGKRALMRFKQLRAAARQGEQENLRNPEVALYAGQLKQKFGKAPTNILEKSLQGGGINFYGMIAWYRSKVASGSRPEDAYYETIQKFAPKSPDAVEARRRRIGQLQAKRLGAGI